MPTSPFKPITRKRPLTAHEALERLRKAHVHVDAPTPAQALNWYRKKLKELGGVSQDLLLRNRKRVSATPIIGKLFFFRYDPKWKKELNYYDVFPLTIPIDFYTRGSVRYMLGLNLHYLPPKLRVVLMAKLLEFATNTKLDETTRLRFTYGMLKGFAQFKEVVPCIKLYILSKVKSQFIQIDAPDWETACFLPVEAFRKQSKTSVWADSIRKMNNSNWTRQMISTVRRKSKAKKKR